MNQPIEDRIKRLEEEQRQLKEEMRKLKEQQTEPIKITRLEIDSGSMHKGLDAVQEDTAVLKIQMQGARADLLSIKATQSDHGEFLQEDRQIQSHHAEKLDQHTEVLGQLVSFAESHDALLKATATKDDVSRMETRFDRLEEIMMQILNRSPKTEGE
jgi:hypothetical protein